MKYTKFFITCASLLLLNGCLEVDDDNAEVAQAINAQTALIAEQQSSEPSVTFHGVVVDIFDDQPVSSALVSVNVGTETFVEELITTNGAFQITKLPANSDIDIIISSENDQFLTRVFFFNTGDSTANVAIKDLGLLAVSEPQDVQITVLNSEDNSSVATLELYAYSHVGTSSSMIKYKHSSVYDAVNEQYNIRVPKHINTVISANLDADRDGTIDFIPESSNYLYGTDLSISSANTINTLTLYVEDNNDIDTVIPDVEYRVSIVDNNTKPIVTAELVLEDTNNRLVKSVYDSVTEQHVLSAKFSQQITLNMPAFTDNGIYYQSASITLYEEAGDKISVYTSGTNSNYSYDIPNAAIIELALVPNITSNVSALEVITKTQEIDSLDSSFTVFYSQGISIPAESISLVSTNGFSTVKGSDNADDFILPGTTLFTGELNMPASHTVSLNNTKLKITPASPLILPGEYKYTVSDVEVNSTNELVDIYDDTLAFTIVNSAEVFDINDVKLDNENFTTNGASITMVNTANQASTSSDNNGNVYFYLPTSINSLQNFTMRQLSVTEDNIASTAVYNFTFVDNGYVSASSYGTVKSAENENFIYEDMQINVITGSAQDDAQFVYRASNYYMYMSDNTATSANTVSFEYAYETISGEISTGVITLPVQ